MKRSKAFMLGLALIIVLSIVVGLSVRQILSINNGYLVELVDVQHARDGIGGGCAAGLFDSQGNFVDCNLVVLAGLSPDYVGLAPLYEVGLEEAYNTLDDYGKSIDPFVAQQGLTIFPLVFNVHVPSDKVAVGESSEIAVEAKILDHFPDDPEMGVVSAVPFSPTVPVSVSFSLATTTFDFSAASPQSVDKMLGMNWPALESWIISPKERVIGDQVLVASVHSQDFSVATKVYLRVHSLSGFNPRLVAILSAVGTFLLGLIGIVKVVPEIMIRYKEAMGKRISK